MWTTSERGRKLVLVSCLLLIAASWVPAAEADSAPIPSWKALRGDAPSAADPFYDDASWEAIDFPASLKTARANDFVWLRARLPAEAVSGGDGQLHFLLGRLDAAAEIFLNGTLVARRGSFPPAYVSNANEPGVFLLPSSMLKRDGGDLVALRLFVPSSSTAVGRLAIIGDAEAAHQKGAVTFFNVGLYALLAALCAFIGVYFLLLWIGKRSDFTNFWYAVSSLSIAYYFADMGSSVSIVPYALNRALAKACLTVSMTGLVGFFLVYFKVRRPRWLVPALAALTGLPVAAYLALRGDFSAVNQVFLLGLLYVQGAIFFIAFVTIRGVLRGDRESIPLLVGVALGVGFGTYDVVHKVAGIEPFAWMQGIGFFFLNLSLFVTLTLRAARLNRELERYTVDVEAKTAQLASYVERIGSVSDSVTVIAERIDADAEGAAAAADKLSAAAERIGGNAEKQAAVSAESAEAVGRLAEALRSIRQGVDSQAGGIADVAASIQVIANEAEAVAANVGRTAEFARSLDGTAEKGRAAVSGLTDAIERIKETSRGISSIVDAVEDFAERTNLLAMNAAIEAAHSGSAGRGFAVIANEIKGLAGASADRASKIRESVAEISLRIGNGVESNERVRSALGSVAEGAKTASAGIADIVGALSSQRDAVDRLRTSLDDLSRAADSIKGEAERRDADARKVTDRMAELAALSDDLRVAISGIVAENAAIAESIRRLALVSRDGKQASVGLRELLDSRRGA